MFFTDIHIHALYGVDDGAKTEAEMQAIVDASYADGIRTLCVTPHFHPGILATTKTMPKLLIKGWRHIFNRNTRIWSCTAGMNCDTAGTVFPG